MSISILMKLRLEKNGYTSMTDDLNMVNNKITNLADPSRIKMLFISSI